MTLRYLLFILLLAAPAFADETNQVVLRGNYWRDRNTRVLQPEAALSKELPSGTILGAHYLLDTITSASLAAGAAADHPFTELRNEAGFSLAQRAGRALMSVGYSYSSESDYWAHLISLGTIIDLFQKNTTLALSMTWGINHVAQRAGPTVFVPVGGMQSWSAIASWTQALSPQALAILEYDLFVIGFGDQLGHITGSPNEHSGYQANPYRSVNVGGSPVREQVPFQRIRQSVSLTLHWYIATGNSIAPYVVFRPSYRFYWDDWGMLSHAPELRTYVAVGPFEFRLTGRYYTQNAASFTSVVEGIPSYADGAGRTCSTCIAESSHELKGVTQLYFTSDPKLYAWDSFFVEGRIALSLRGLARLRKLPLHDWLAGGIIELSYGHYFDSKLAHAAYGDADVAGLSFTFPL